MKDFRISKWAPRHMLAITATLIVAFLIVLTWTIVLVLSPPSSGDYQYANANGTGNTARNIDINSNGSTSNGPWEAIAAIGGLGTAAGAVLGGIAALESRRASVSEKATPVGRPLGPAGTRLVA